MPAMLYGYPFNEELFSYLWRNEPDIVTTALIDSGVLQNNAEIANLISTGSATYTVPFYKTIGGEPANYNGTEDVPMSETEGAYQSGIVFGRMQGWKAKDFIVDFNSGADPMHQIASQVSQFWAKYHQMLIVKILNAVFGVTATDDFAQWADHTTDISSASATVAASNKLGATSIGDATVKACGDLATGAFNLAIMHSTVANNLAGLDLLEFRKYTDPMGIQRNLPIADVNGQTVVVSDQVPVDTTGDAPKYTTYVLGTGAIQTAEAPVEHPLEYNRDPVTAGGVDMLITRERRTYQPNGFSFEAKQEDIPSPTNEALGSSDRYKLIYNPKSIAMAKIVSNG